MVALTSTGEVANLLNESQFVGGRSAFECVSYCAALIKYAAQPGHSITGTNMEVSNLAQYWYGRLEGGNDSSNTNGMSLQAEYTMLQGLGLKYYPVPGNFLVYIKAWLELGYPLLICGAETGMHDLDMGDAVPYSWIPTGNHCIVASGIASDGNLLVRDTASIAPTGVRPGPRRYDISKLQLISATAVGMPWLPVLPDGFDPTKEENVTIDISNPDVANYFTALSATQWQCKQTGNVVHDGILGFYKGYGNAALCGLTFLGLPKSGELVISQTPYIVLQFFERGVVCWDTEHKFDNPPGSGPAYMAQLYNDGRATDPRLVTARQQIQQLQAQLAAQPPSQAQAILDKLKLDVPQAQAGLDKLKADLGV